MTTISLSLPETLRQWMEKQIAEGRYENAGEYVRSLIEHDRKRLEDMRRAIEEGERSGLSPRNVLEVMKQTKADIKNG